MLRNLKQLLVSVKGLSKNCTPGYSLDADAICGKAGCRSTFNRLSRVASICAPAQIKI
jgi:hypothetical protein